MSSHKKNAKKHTKKHNKLINTNTEIDKVDKENKVDKEDKVDSENRSIEKSFSMLDKKVSRKPLHMFEIERVSNIMKIIPQFVKFYNKLSQDDIMAIKYYKGWGSRFQSELLSDYNRKPDEPRKIRFPFKLNEEKMLQRDILGNKTIKLLPLLTSFDIKSIPEYIKNSYSTRIELLNRLDKVYEHKDCPKMTGKEVLYRGMRMNDDLKKLKIGSTYTFKNFISTTIDKKVAEEFSGASYGDDSKPCIFVLTSMKDLPYIYMPPIKIVERDNYSKNMMNAGIYHDLSEYTLPRNLEFKIEKVIIKPLSSQHIGNYGLSIKKLETILKKKGYINNTTASTDADKSDLEGNNLEGNNLEEETKEEIIEKHLFTHATFFYCTLKTWHVRNPISWTEISLNAKFILDKSALSSWNNDNYSF
jgi:hypothetical protein